MVTVATQHYYRLQCVALLALGCTLLILRSSRSSFQASVTGRLDLYNLLRLGDGEKVAKTRGTIPKSGKDQTMVNIYAGNLSYELTESDLRNMFEAHGKVDRASVVMDRVTGHGKGFGFVEMPNDKEARTAISALNEMETHGRKMMVNEAKPKEDRPPRRDRY